MGCCYNPSPPHLEAVARERETPLLSAPPPPQPRGPARGYGPRRRAERQRDHDGDSEASGRPLLSPPRLPQGRRGSRTKMPASRARLEPGVAQSDYTPPLHSPPPPQKIALGECREASAQTNRRPPRPASSWAAYGSGPGMLETSSAPRPLPHSLPVRGHPDPGVAEGTPHTAQLANPLTPGSAPQNSGCDSNHSQARGTVLPPPLRPS